MYMVRLTLVRLRERIYSLASDEGTYDLICVETGDQPIPTNGLRVATRDVARRAARATEQYRAILRQYDSQFQHSDLIICQGSDCRSNYPEGCPFLRSPELPSKDRRAGQNPTSERPQLVIFCLNVAAALFETLASGGYETIESAMMDAYADLARTHTDPTDLCVRLLERMALELDAGLSAGEQRSVISHVVRRLEPTESSTEPVRATFRLVQEMGLVGDYTQTPWSIDLMEGIQSAVVRLSEYALEPQNGQLPVLPIVVDLQRRRPEWSLSSLRVVDDENGWRVTVEQSREATPTGRASVPIQSNV